MTYEPIQITPEQQKDFFTQLHALNDVMARIQKTLLFAAESLHSAQIFAARMSAAKKDCDFNEARNMAWQAYDRLVERYNELFPVREGRRASRPENRGGVG